MSIRWLCAFAPLREAVFLSTLFVMEKGTKGLCRKVLRFRAPLAKD